MKGNLLGIEIGSSRMKIVEINRGRVVRFHVTDLPDGVMKGQELIAWDAMVDILKEAVSKNGFRSRKCAMVISDDSTYLRRLTMPPMNEAQLLVNLPYEYHDIINDDKEAYIYDYSMIDIHKDESGKPVEMELLGAAVSKELIKKYQELCRRAGLKLIIARPRNIALQAFLRKYVKDFHEKDLAILDLGSTASTIDIFHNGIYEVTRTIDTGVNDIVAQAAEILKCDPHIAREYLKTNKNDVQSSEKVAQIYENVSVEIMRALNYFSFENPDNTLENLYYFGGGAWIAPFVQDIATNVSLQLTPLSDLTSGSKEAIIDGAASVGVCVD